MDPRCKSAALLFGLNYPGTPAALAGCVNDVTGMAAFLRERLGFGDVQVLADDGPGARPEETTGAAMVRHLYAMALRSWAEQLDVVWLHYSGHGSWVRDAGAGRDERDGRDEALCPADFEAAGLIKDDVLQQLLALFNPRTQVVFVVDACHSGTVGDLRWSWTAARGAVQENARAVVKARVLMISGCRDDQTSADAWDARDRRFEGALTGALLDALTADPGLVRDAFAVVRAARALLAARGFAQVPVLTSSVDLRAGPVHLVPPPPPPAAVPAPTPATAAPAPARRPAAGLALLARPGALPARP